MNLSCHFLIYLVDLVFVYFMFTHSIYVLYTILNINQSIYYIIVLFNSISSIQSIIDNLICIVINEYNYDQLLNHISFLPTTYYYVDLV